MRERPFLCMGLASFLSLLLCAVLPTVGVIVVLTVLLLLLAVAIVLRRRLGGGAIAAMLCALVLCGGFLLKHAIVVYPQVSYAGNTAYVTVRVEETVAIGKAYIVRTQAGDLPEGMRLYMWVNEDIAPVCGDTLTAEVTLKAAYDKYNEDGRFAKSNGIYLNAVLHGETPLAWEDGSASLSVYERVLVTLRDEIHNTLYRHLSFDDAALCEGMLLGNRSNLSVQTADNFRVSGVYHLLVVSGLHLSLIVTVLLRLLGFLRVPRVARVLAAMAAAVLFSTLCGFSPSVNRALIMTLLMLLAGLLHRDADGLNSLGLAAVVLLLLDPFCIYDVGWQLSFAATLGMFTVLPVWEKEVTTRLPWWPLRPLLSAVGVAVAATLMTQPLTALYFGELSLVFILGNLLCVTVSSVLLVGCIVSFAVGWLPGVGEAAYTLIHGLCLFLTESTAWLARLPFASLAVREPFVIVWLFALVIVLCAAYVLSQWRGVVRAAALLLSVLFISVSVYAVCDAGVTTVRILPLAKTAFLVDTKDSCGLVFEGDSKALTKASSALSQNGVRELDWLLLLNTTDEQAVDPAALALPVEWLLTTEEPEDYRSLPQAVRCEMLLSGQTLRFSEEAMIARDGEAFYLRLGDTKLLLCPPTEGEMTLAQDWTAADVVLLRGQIPQNLATIEADTLVMYCMYGLEEHYDTLLPRRFETVHYAVGDGECRLQTRGYGDITLRDG